MGKRPIESRSERTATDEQPRGFVDTSGPTHTAVVNGGSPMSGFGPMKGIVNKAEEAARE